MYPPEIGEDDPRMETRNEKKRCIFLYFHLFPRENTPQALPTSLVFPFNFLFLSRVMLPLRAARPPVVDILQD